MTKKTSNIYYFNRAGVSSLILFVFSTVPVHRLLHYSVLKGKFSIQFGIIIPIRSRHAPSRRHRLCKWAFPGLSLVFTKKRFAVE